jgi:DNA repair protein RadC
VTRRLAQAGATLGVDLLDHLVVGDPDWASLARDGVL